jgi:hypothetical protein
MATADETRNENDGAADRTQRELTRSVGTTLTRPTKTRRKLFGRRRDRQAEKS